MSKEILRTVLFGSFLNLAYDAKVRDFKAHEQCICHQLLALKGQRKSKRFAELTPLAFEEGHLH